MCRHKSAWLTPAGDLLHCPQTDAHDAIARVHKIRDIDAHRDLRAIRVELTWPADPSQIADLAAWTFALDEPSRPEWATDDVLARAREHLTAIVEREFVRDERGTVAGGTMIILPTGRILELLGGRIVWAVGADLSGARLSGADLRDANLRGASLSGADLRGADLRDAYAPGSWELPPGWEHDVDGYLRALVKS